MGKNGDFGGWERSIVSVYILVDIPLSLLITGELSHNTRLAIGCLLSTKIFLLSFKLCLDYWLSSCVPWYDSTL